MLYRVLCPNEHKCEKMCFEDCGDCQVPVLRILPCKHEAFLPCSLEWEKYLCQELVLTTLPCEHAVNTPCHKDPTTFSCPIPCQARIDKCGHSCDLFCHIRKDPHHIRVINFFHFLYFNSMTEFLMQFNVVFVSNLLHKVTLDTY